MIQWITVNHQGYINPNANRRSIDLHIKSLCVWFSNKNYRVYKTGSQYTTIKYGSIIELKNTIRIENSNPCIYNLSLYLLYLILFDKMQALISKYVHHSFSNFKFTYNAFCQLEFKPKSSCIIKDTHSVLIKFWEIKYSHQILNRFCFIRYVSLHLNWWKSHC